MPVLIDSSSASTIKRRKRDLGILGPRQAARQLPKGQQRQMVLDQMADDPRRNRGPRTVQEGVFIRLEFDYHGMRGRAAALTSVLTLRKVP